MATMRLLFVHKGLIHPNNLRVHPQINLHTLFTQEDWFLKFSISLAHPTAILRAFIHSLLFLEMLSNSKSFTALIVLLISTSSSTNAQAAPPNPPALDLQETPISGEAQRPSIADPCSNVNIAQSLDTSTSVTADETGAFLLSPVNLNPGADGSRSIETVQVDTSGTGKNFVAAQMAPANDDTQQFTIQLPAGTKCTGGTNQNLCLASITTTSGLENCVVVSQAANAVDRARSPLNTSQAADVHSGVGKRKRVKRSPPADEEGSEPAPAKGDQTSPRKGDKLKKDKRKEKKDKGTTRHNQRITGKRFWSSRLSQLAKLR